MTAHTSVDHAHTAFEALAHRYDLYTAHHDYDHWMGTLHRLASEHGLEGGRLLDVACGTGKSFMPFLRRGFEVTACDVSPAMLDRAAAKAGDAAQLLKHDMRELPRLGSFDLVCCIDDAVNYLLSRKELSGALAGMARNLAPDGVLVFDVNTMVAYRDFYGALHVFHDADGVVIWDGTTPSTFEEGGIATAVATVLTPTGDAWGRTTASHYQRHHPRADVEAALSSAGLSCVGVYGMQLDGSVQDGYAELGNSKAVFVARLASSA